MSLSPFSRSPLLVLSILIIAVFGFRAFLSVPFRRGSSAEKLQSRSEISMLTFNIWFAAEKMQERMAALGKIVENLKPDLLTFQEVTRDNLALLRQQKWFARYYLTPPGITREGRYFDIILTVFPVDKWHVYQFKNSPLNRKLITAEIKGPVSSSKSPRFVIATTHLEHSGTYAQLREEHLRESLKMLSTYDNVCVMGDMNIEGQFDGDVILPWQWVDAWLTLPGNTNSNGYTWDQSKNPFIRKHGVETSLKDRFDRVFCKLRDFKVKEMKIVGSNHTVKTSVLPSDHFGLFTVVEISAKTAEKHKKHSQTVSEVYFKRPPSWEKLIKQ
ncbi:uncharacterized protein LOC110052737 [Orbicella faveolata]|uniref:uncharacterized protein LOC110052737 n=1 Tax=Orbicella faveolata TaxID=48498 RepID=UPI0009E2C6C2|nr:uncharacterized protein LOC110052737 [Orbicella faveolata]